MKLVSVVITTKNEQDNIERCLLSVSSQSYTRIEIIVVDNNSSDDTKLISRRYTKKVFNKGPERSAQRNYGIINKASGFYVLYLDADMIITPHLIEDCVRYMELSEVVALYLPELVLGRSLFARIRRFERSFYSGTAIDAVRFFRKDSFVKIGGFDQELFKSGSGEDWDLDKKFKEIGECKLLPKWKDRKISAEIVEIFEETGTPIDHTFAGILHNESNDRLLAYLRKKKYYSTGFAGYVAKWGTDDPDVRKQFGFFYRFFQVFLENGGWRKIARKPHMYFMLIFMRLFVAVYSAKSLFLLKYIKSESKTKS